MIWGRIRGVVKGREMTEEEKKVPAVGEKDSRRRTVVIAAAVAAIIVLGGAGGGYAYAANKAYEAYESQVESAKAIDSKLVKKIENAQNLAKATKDTDVLDKTLLGSLNASVKSGEAQKGSPKAEAVNKWMLWDVSKAKTTVADDISAATKAISSIDAAMGKVESSKTAKQVKDAKDTLNKTISDAETLYKDSEGKVSDDKTRESLKTAIDTAKKTVDDKKSDVKTLNAERRRVQGCQKRKRLQDGEGTSRRGSQSRGSRTPSRTTTVASPNPNLLEHELQSCEQWHQHLQCSDATSPDPTVCATTKPEPAEQ